MDDKNIGKKYGLLTVLSFDREGKNSSHKWYYCKCECGNVKSIRIDSLKSGTTIACGCVRSKRAKSLDHKTLKLKHGMSNTKIYHTWCGMRRRCLSNTPKASRYKDRGIKVCDEWVNSFDSFFSYVSKLEHYGEEGYTLDRIDNNGNYEPNNVRWATSEQQSLNKENTIRIKYMGREQTLVEWCKELGLNYDTIRARHQKGWKVPMLFSEKHKNQYG